MYSKLCLMLLLMGLSIDQIKPFVYDEPKNIFVALSGNGGMFDYGFTFTYVGVSPLEFEYFLFIKYHFWKIVKSDFDERVVCFEKLESEQHPDFDMKFNFALSYLSNHLIDHVDELNLTNHVLMEMSLMSSTFLPEFEHHELVENAFDANHPNLDYLVEGNYHEFPIHHFNCTVGFQPQSFTDDDVTDGPNFVFIQQNKTDQGYIRRSEVHSLSNKEVKWPAHAKVMNTTEQFGKYIPAFIDKLDPSLYINVILPTRVGPGGVEEGTHAVILLFPMDGVIRYCVTEEAKLHESCHPDNLKQLLHCVPRRDEL